MESSLEWAFVTDSDTIKQALKPYIGMTDKEQQSKAMEIAGIISRFAIGGTDFESRERRRLAEGKTRAN